MIWDEFSLAVRLSILFSGLYLWVGMLTGLWKYWQIQKSAQARAHYYVDIAHRSSLLYAPATLILAVLAFFSIWSDSLNLFFVVINLFFFSFSILSYVLHGFLQDTQNQFRQPHQLGKRSITPWMMKVAMWALVVAELGATAALLLGAAFHLFG